MTAVALPVTGAAAPVRDAAHPSPRAGFALWVGVGDTEAERAQLAALAEAVVRMVAEMAPTAVAHTALTLRGRGAKGDLVARLRDELAGPTVPSQGRGRSATARAERAWRGEKQPRVVVDTVARQVVVDGRPVVLTFQEFALLEYLLRSPHRAVGREELLTTVWRDRPPAAGSRTIDVHVRRLREKLGARPQIVTIRGVGYRCDPAPDTVLVGSGDAG